jgi:hypothetical protein
MERLKGFSLMNTRRVLLARWTIGVIALFASSATIAWAASNQVLSWNNLGMHCMDSDYSVFSILPPYNTIEAQLIVGGKLLANNTGYNITYQAVADPAGSFNSTSLGKGNFYDFTADLYGALPVNAGLAGWSMPGTNNTPQSMLFENTNTPAAGAHVLVNWFRAEGIPLTPYDDAFQKNPYPMMRIIATDAASNVLASSAIVLPVSDEMDCRACHASGTQTAAQPAAGWVFNSNPERDFRLNILRLHDEKQFASNAVLYANALAARGFNPLGLYTNVVVDGKPILCAVCHASEALGTASYGTIPQLTTSVHSLHASVIDPTQGITLDSLANRSACYRCHPGSTTKCLRGAMGAAIAADGSMAMQCQSCHGNMSTVGSSGRVGWFMEPNCQNCHTGPATHNNGQIRYTSAFDGASPRVAVDPLFATSTDTPAPGISLFRFSSGHGGLQCEACHGSTHAEFPSTHANDNVRNIQLQGHVGVMVECTACHVTVPNTVNGGPHGLHPVGQSWVNQHGGLIESGTATRAQCQACHGLDYRGTVLSRAQADRQLAANSDSGTTTIQLFRGAEVGCYACHDGPNSENINYNLPPTVGNISTNTALNQSVTMILPATGTSLILRIISQPAHGSVGLSGNVATYFPDTDFSGMDGFTFAAFDGAKNSTLGHATIAVGVPLDTNAPVVKIISPTIAATYSANSSSLNLSGTATDNVAVASVSWSNDRGGSGSAIGTTNWSVNGITLQAGVNVITVTALDAANNAGSDSLTVTYSGASALTILINGNGTVSPNLNGQNLKVGKSYTLTAKPASSFVFANWTGDILAGTPSITFVFQAGMVLQANFITNPFVPVKGTYNGLFAENEVRPNSSGSFTLTTTTSGLFTGKLLSGAQRFSLNGQFNAVGYAHVNIPRPNMTALTVELWLNLAGGTDQIHGSASDGTWTADLAGDRAVYDGKTHIAPQAGRYTLALPCNPNSTTQPGGYSYGTVTVSPAGQIILAGLLADGTPINLSSTISKNGAWPLYAQLPKGQDMLWSWMIISNSLSGPMSWIKPAVSGAKLYPAAFTIDTAAFGSAYARPATGTRILNCTNGLLVLSGGNLSQNITNHITLNANNTVTSTDANSLKLSFTPTTGAFKGSVVDLVSLKTISFGGVVLQNGTIGYGCFLGATQSGAISLGP